MMKSGVSDVSDEDATRTLATCPQKFVRFGLVEFGERHDTWTNGQHHNAADQSVKRMASWTGKSPDARATSSRWCRACRRRCRENATRMLRENCSRGIPADTHPTDAARAGVRLLRDDVAVTVERRSVRRRTATLTTTLARFQLGDPPLSRRQLSTTPRWSDDSYTSCGGVRAAGQSWCIVWLL